MSPLKRIFLAALLYLYVPDVFATEAREEQFSEHQLAFIEQWNLTSKEYERFLEILSGPFGYYSPNLEKNPILALGLGARTDDERERYARQYVQMEFDKNVAILAFQQTVNTEWERAFPSSLAAAGMDGTNQHYVSSQAGAPTRLKFYVTVDCKRCNAEFERLYDEAMQGGPAVDVYFAGNPSQEAIRQWAAAQGVVSNHVNVLRLVTLNYADKEFSSYPHTEPN